MPRAAAACLLLQALFHTVSAEWENAQVASLGLPWSSAEQMEIYTSCITKLERSERYAREWCAWNESANNLRNATGWAWWWHEAGAPSAEQRLACFRRKRVMFVGDSLTRQQHSTLTCELSALGMSDAELARHVKLRSSTQLFDPTLESDGGHKRHHDVAPAWVEELGKGGWDAVVLNTGHHYKRSKKRIASFKSAIKAIVKHLRKALQRQDTLRPENVIFRSISTRHFPADLEWNEAECACEGLIPDLKAGVDIDCGCCRHEAPDFEAAAQEFAGGSAREKQLDIMRSIVEPSEFTLMDVEPTSLPRVDQHNGVDCSHYCLPGVPDSWNTKLGAWICPADPQPPSTI